MQALRAFGRVLRIPFYVPPRRETRFRERLLPWPVNGAITLLLLILLAPLLTGRLGESPGGARVVGYAVVIPMTFLGLLLTAVSWRLRRELDEGSLANADRSAPPTHVSVRRVNRAGPQWAWRVVGVSVTLILFATVSYVILSGLSLIGLGNRPGFGQAAGLAFVGLAAGWGASLGERYRNQPPDPSLENPDYPDPG